MLEKIPQPSAPARLSCSWERFPEVASELRYLSARQQAEIGDGYEPYDPDWDRYFAFDRAGSAMVWTARTLSGVLVGYVIWLTTAQDSSAWCLSTLRAGPWNFSFQGVPDGAWKLGASRAGPLPVSSTPPAGTIWYPGVAGWSRAGVIQVQGGADLPGLDISLARPR